MPDSPTQSESLSAAGPRRRMLWLLAGLVLAICVGVLCRWLFLGTDDPRDGPVDVGEAGLPPAIDVAGIVVESETYTSGILPIRYHAEDDYGVRRVIFTYWIEAGFERRRVVFDAGPASTRKMVDAVFHLDVDSLRPRNRRITMAWYLTAEDVFGQATRSPVQIISSNRSPVYDEDLEFVASTRKLAERLGEVRKELEAVHKDEVSGEKLQAAFAQADAKLAGLESSFSNMYGLAVYADSVSRLRLEHTAWNRLQIWFASIVHTGAGYPDAKDLQIFLDEVRRLHDAAAAQAAAETVRVVELNYRQSTYELHEISKVRRAGETMYTKGRFRDYESPLIQDLLSTVRRGLAAAEGVATKDALEPVRELEKKLAASRDAMVDSTKRDLADADVQALVKGRIALRTLLSALRKQSGDVHVPLKSVPASIAGLLTGADPAAASLILSRASDAFAREAEFCRSDDAVMLPSALAFDRLAVVLRELSAASDSDETGKLLAVVARGVAPLYTERRLAWLAHAYGRDRNYFVSAKAYYQKEVEGFRAARVNRYDVRREVFHPVNERMWQAFRERMSSLHVHIAEVSGPGPFLNVFATYPGNLDQVLEGARKNDEGTFHNFRTKLGQNFKAHEASIAGPLSKVRTKADVLRQQLRPAQPRLSERFTAINPVLTAASQVLSKYIGEEHSGKKKKKKEEQPLPNSKGILSEIDSATAVFRATGRRLKSLEVSLRLRAWDRLRGGSVDLDSALLELALAESVKAVRLGSYVKASRLLALVRDRVVRQGADADEDIIRQQLRQAAAAVDDGLKLFEGLASDAVVAEGWAAGTSSLEELESSVSTLSAQSGFDPAVLRRLGRWVGVDGSLAAIRRRMTLNPTGPDLERTRADIFQLQRQVWAYSVGGTMIKQQAHTRFKQLWVANISKMRHDLSQGPRGRTLVDAAVAKNRTITRVAVLPSERNVSDRLSPLELAYSVHEFVRSIPYPHYLSESGMATWLPFLVRPRGGDPVLVRLESAAAEASALASAPAAEGHSIRTAALLAEVRAILAADRRDNPPSSVLPIILKLVGGAVTEMDADGLRHLFDYLRSAAAERRYLMYRGSRGFGYDINVQPERVLAPMLPYPMVFHRDVATVDTSGGQGPGTSPALSQVQESANEMRATLDGIERYWPGYVVLHSERDFLKKFHPLNAGVYAGWEWQQNLSEFDAGLYPGTRVAACNVMAAMSHSMILRPLGPLSKHHKSSDAVKKFFIAVGLKPPAGGLRRVYLDASLEAQAFVIERAILARMDQLSGRLRPTHRIAQLNNKLLALRYSLQYRVTGAGQERRASDPRGTLTEIGQRLVSAVRNLPMTTTNKLRDMAAPERDLTVMRSAEMSHRLLPAALELERLCMELQTRVASNPPKGPAPSPRSVAALADDVRTRANALARAAAPLFPDYSPVPPPGTGAGIRVAGHLTNARVLCEEIRLLCSRAWRMERQIRDRWWDSTWMQKDEMNLTVDKQRLNWLFREYYWWRISHQSRQMLNQTSHVHYRYFRRSSTTGVHMASLDFMDRGAEAYERAISDSATNAESLKEIAAYLRATTEAVRTGLYEKDAHSMRSARASMVRAVIAQRVQGAAIRLSQILTDSAAADVDASMQAAVLEKMATTLADSHARGLVAMSYGGSSGLFNLHRIDEIAEGIADRIDIRLAQVTGRAPAVEFTPPKQSAAAKSKPAPDPALVAAAKRRSDISKAALDLDLRLREMRAAAWARTDFERVVRDHGRQLDVAVRNQVRRVESLARPFIDVTADETLREWVRERLIKMKAMTVRQKDTLPEKHMAGVRAELVKFRDEFKKRYKQTPKDVTPATALKYLLNHCNGWWSTDITVASQLSTLDAAARKQVVTAAAALAVQTTRLQTVAGADTASADLTKLAAHAKAIVKEAGTESPGLTEIQAMAHTLIRVRAALDVKTPLEQSVVRFPEWPPDFSGIPTRLAAVRRALATSSKDQNDSMASLSAFQLEANRVQEELIRSYKEMDKGIKTLSRKVRNEKLRTDILAMWERIFPQRVGNYPYYVPRDDSLLRMRWYEVELGKLAAMLYRAPAPNSSIRKVQDDYAKGIQAFASEIAGTGRDLQILSMTRWRHAARRLESVHEVFRSARAVEREILNNYGTIMAAETFLSHLPLACEDIVYRAHMLRYHVLRNSLEAADTDRLMITAGLARVQELLDQGSGGVAPGSGPAEVGVANLITDLSSSSGAFLEMLLAQDEQERAATTTAMRQLEALLKRRDTGLTAMDEALAKMAEGKRKTDLAKRLEVVRAVAAATDKKDPATTFREFLDALTETRALSLRAIMIKGTPEEVNSKMVKALADFRQEAHGRLLEIEVRRTWINEVRQRLQVRAFKARDDAQALIRALPEIDPAATGETARDLRVARVKLERAVDGILNHDTPFADRHGAAVDLIDGVERLWEVIEKHEVDRQLQVWLGNRQGDWRTHRAGAQPGASVTNELDAGLAAMTNALRDLGEVSTAAAADKKPANDVVPAGGLSDVLALSDTRVAALPLHLRRAVRTTQAQAWYNPVAADANAGSVLAVLDGADTVGPATGSVRSDLQWAVRIRAALKGIADVKLPSAAPPADPRPTDAKAVTAQQKAAVFAEVLLRIGLVSGKLPPDTRYDMMSADDRKIITVIRNKFNGISVIDKNAELKTVMDLYTKAKIPQGSMPALAEALPHVRKAQELFAELKAEPFNKTDYDGIAMNDLRKRLASMDKAINTANIVWAHALLQGLLKAINDFAAPPAGEVTLNDSAFDGAAVAAAFGDADTTRLAMAGDYSLAAERLRTLSKSLPSGPAQNLAKLGAQSFVVGAITQRARMQMPTMANFVDNAQKAIASIPSAKEKSAAHAVLRDIRNGRGAAAATGLSRLLPKLPNNLKATFNAVDLALSKWTKAHVQHRAQRADWERAVLDEITFLARDISDPVALTELHLAEICMTNLGSPRAARHLYRAAASLSGPRREAAVRLAGLVDDLRSAHAHVQLDRRLLSARATALGQWSMAAEWLRQVGADNGPERQIAEELDGVASAVTQAIVDLDRAAGSEVKPKKIKALSRAAALARSGDLDGAAKAAKAGGKPGKAAAKVLKATAAAGRKAAATLDNLYAGEVVTEATEFAALVTHLQAYRYSEAVSAAEGIPWISRHAPALRSSDDRLPTMAAALASKVIATADPKDKEILKQLVGMMRKGDIDGVLSRLPDGSNYLNDVYYNLTIMMAANLQTSRSVLESGWRRNTGEIQSMVLARSLILKGRFRSAALLMSGYPSGIRTAGPFLATLDDLDRVTRSLRAKITEPGASDKLRTLLPAVAAAEAGDLARAVELARTVGRKGKTLAAACEKVIDRAPHTGAALVIIQSEHQFESREALAAAVELARESRFFDAAAVAVRAGGNDSTGALVDAERVWWRHVHSMRDRRGTALAGVVKAYIGRDLAGATAAVYQVSAAKPDTTVVGWLDQVMRQADTALLSLRRRMTATDLETPGARAVETAVMYAARPDIVRTAALADAFGYRSSLPSLARLQVQWDRAIIEASHLADSNESVNSPMAITVRRSLVALRKSDLDLAASLASAAGPDAKIVADAINDIRQTFGDARNELRLELARAVKRESTVIEKAIASADSGAFSEAADIAARVSGSRGAVAAFTRADRQRALGLRLLQELERTSNDKAIKFVIQEAAKAATKGDMDAAVTSVKNIGDLGKAVLGFFDKAAAEKKTGRASLQAYLEGLAAVEQAEATWSMWRRRYPVFEDGAGLRPGGWSAIGKYYYNMLYHTSTIASQAPAAAVTMLDNLNKQSLQPILSHFRAAVVSEYVLPEMVVE